MSLPDNPPPAGPVSPQPDHWAFLRRHTPARIALGRTGVSLPTREVLDFSLAHAQARDAIHQPLDLDALEQSLRPSGWPQPLRLHSRARDRHEYLLRPDLGRRLDDASRAQLLDWRTQHSRGQAIDLLLVLGDGLSCLGVQRHAAALLESLRAALTGPDGPTLHTGPLVLVSQARVAVADEVGELLGARMVAMVLGERPGLSSPDSLGIYLTAAPRVGCNDAQRNCISNVRPEGQQPATAARRLLWLVREGQRLGATGVALKDMSGLPLVEAPLSPPAPHLPGHST